MVVPKENCILESGPVSVGVMPNPHKRRSQAWMWLNNEDEDQNPECLMVTQNLLQGSHVQLSGIMHVKIDLLHHI
jgi:hypothetical protein